MTKFETFIRLNLRFLKLAKEHMVANFNLNIMKCGKMFVSGDVE